MPYDLTYAIIEQDPFPTESILVVAQSQSSAEDVVREMKPGAAKVDTTLLYIDYGSCGDTNLYMC